MRTSSSLDDKRVNELVEKAAAAVEDGVFPKTLYRIFDCEVADDGVNIAGVTFKSKHLADNLNGCKRVVIFGATLGTECDRLINSAAATDVALAMAIQAAGACKIEEVCDELESAIIAEHKVKLRQRFSPGYYDLDISAQKKVFDLLELTKRIGITLTDTYEMLPTKSVTAFIGIE